MKFSLTLRLFLFILGGFPAIQLSVLSATPLPVTDNTAPPYLGVWEPMYEGTNGTDDFAAWLNRKGLFPVVTQYLFDAPGFPTSFDRYWVDPKWTKWVADQPGRKTVIFVSLPLDSAALERGAQGALDGNAASLAKYLVANGLGNSIICMGLINSPGSWGEAQASDLPNFILCWQQIVKAVRAVPGAEKLQFDWVGMNRKTSFPIESAWPGDAYVDYVGMILFDQCPDKSIYPLPTDATEDQKRERWQKAWDSYYYPASQNGLEAWRGLAKVHHKPFSLPLWCLYSDHDADGTTSTGGDNPFFIQQMHDFIQNPANDVYFSCYMDIYLGCTKISTTAYYRSNYPKSSALFQQLFGLPGYKPAPAPAKP